MTESTAAVGVVAAAQSAFQLREPNPQKTAGEPRTFTLRPVLRSSEAATFQSSGDAIVPTLLATAPAVPAALSITFPVAASGSVSLTDPTSTVTAGVSLVGGTAVAAEVGSGYVVYRGGHATGADVIHRVTRATTEDYLVFSQRPPEPRISYRLALGAGVADVRLIADTIELLDGTGAPRIKMAQPYVVGTDGTLTRAHVAVSGCTVDTRSGEPWGRGVVAPASSTCTIDVSWNDAAVAYPAILDPSWRSGGVLADPRYDHTATTVEGGNVFVIGGQTTTGLATHIESYNYSAGTWSTIGTWLTPRYWHQATYLAATGRVLVSGGRLASGAKIAQADVCNYLTGACDVTVVLNTARSLHSATLLPSGKVLLAGGISTADFTTGTSELYDPAAGTSTQLTNSMATSRSRHAAAVVTLQTTGVKYLMVAGGTSSAVSGELPTAELYNLTGDSTTNTWQAATSMAQGRSFHATTVMQDGAVLLAGGTSSGAQVAAVDVFKPITDSDTLTASPFVRPGTLSLARYNAAAATLPGGAVVVAGGQWDDTSTHYVATTDLYDPQTASWSAGPAMGTARAHHTLTAIPNVRALAVGGYNATSGALASTEFIYFAANGAACTLNTDCQSGFCAATPTGTFTKTCCDSACTGSCQSCNTGTCRLNTGWVPALPAAVDLPVDGTNVRMATPMTLQSLIDTAAAGDVIVLDTTSIYKGQITLKPFTGSGWVTIRSAGVTMTTFPDGNHRVEPDQASNLSKIVPQDSDHSAPVIVTAPGASHYHLIGLDIRNNDTTLDSFPNGIFVVIGDSNAMTSQADHIVFDRCFVHGNSAFGKYWWRGFSLNGEHLAVINSRIFDIKTPDKKHPSTYGLKEAQTIAMWNGKGPYLIQNNYLAASTENMFSGGDTSCSAAMVPSDITIRDNHIHKPRSWRIGYKTVQPDEHPWVKNSLEFKAGRRVLIERNYFENSWKDPSGDQDGVCLGFSPRNQVDGICGGTVPGNPWSGVQDVTVRNNRFVNCGRGIAIAGEGFPDRERQTACMSIHDNVLSGNYREDTSVTDQHQMSPGSNPWDPMFPNQSNLTFWGDGKLFTLPHGLDYATAGLSIVHNTALQNGPVAHVYNADDSAGPDPRPAARSLAGYTFTDNITNYQAPPDNQTSLFGTTGQSLGEGCKVNGVYGVSAFELYLNGATYGNNEMLNTTMSFNPAWYQVSTQGCPSLTAPGTMYYHAGVSAVLFKDFTNEDYSLQSMSPLAGKGLDTLDIGAAAWTELNKAMPSCAVDADCQPGFACLKGAIAYGCARRLPSGSACSDMTCTVSGCRICSSGSCPMGNLCP